MGRRCFQKGLPAGGRFAVARSPLLRLVQFQSMARGGCGTAISTRERGAGSGALRRRWPCVWSLAARVAGCIWG